MRAIFFNIILIYKDVQLDKDIYNMTPVPQKIATIVFSTDLNSIEHQVARRPFRIRSAFGRVRASYYEKEKEYFGKLIDI